MERERIYVDRGKGRKERWLVKAEMEWVGKEMIYERDGMIWEEKEQAVDRGKGRKGLQRLVTAEMRLGLGFKKTKE